MSDLYMFIFVRNFPKLMKNIFVLVFTFLCSTTFSQIVKNTTKITLNKNILTKRVENVFVVNNKDERDLGEIYLSHKDGDNFKVLNAEIVDSSGDVVVRLNKKDVLTRSSFSRYTFHDDYWVSEFNLFWNTYPYTIKYSYQTSIKNFSTIAYWHPIVYNSSTPILSKLEVDIPDGFPYKSDYSELLKFNESKEKGRHYLNWELDKQTVYDDESYSPTFYELIPNVKIIPKNFNYGIEANQSSWESYGNWFLELNKNNLELTLDEKNKIDVLLKEKTNKKDIVETIYTYLQDNTKYVNISLDIGGFKSYPASYVCENKYGDCKALTTFMKALLKYSNIESNYVLINTGNEAKINVDLPSSQFNHIILAVNIDNEVFYLDNTSSTSTIEYVETSNQNRKALWIEENSSHIIDMPKMSEKEVYNLTELSITINKKDEGVYKIKKTAKAYVFEKYAYLNLKVKEDRIKEELIENTPLKNFKLESWFINKNKEDKNSIIIHSNGTLNKQFKNLGNTKVLQPSHLSIGNFKSSEHRETSLRFKKPINEELISTYNLSGFEEYIIEPLKPISLETKFGSYSLETNQEKNTVTLKEKLIIKEGEYSLVDYPEFYAFINSIKRFQKKTIIILKSI